MKWWRSPDGVPFVTFDGQAVIVRDQLGGLMEFKFNGDKPTYDECKPKELTPCPSGGKD